VNGETLVVVWARFDGPSLSEAPLLLLFDVGTMYTPPSYIAHKGYQSLSNYKTGRELA
jgi:hypothetical protein